MFQSHYCRLIPWRSIRCWGANRALNLRHGGDAGVCAQRQVFIYQIKSAASPKAGVVFKRTLLTPLFAGSLLNSFLMEDDGWADCSGSPKGELHLSMIYSSCIDKTAFFWYNWRCSGARESCGGEGRKVSLLYCTLLNGFKSHNGESDTSGIWCQVR